MAEQSVRTMINPVETCRANGWGVGTQLVGDEGYGPTVIEITALGRDHLLAVAISRNGVPVASPRESSWVLWCRDWRLVEVPAMEVGDA